ncbi:MAG: hypothetical protein EPN82_11950 [Bacteroidetes bacterium]|nr:MAG: hypothetical protein EPN82_11950 [Bacteroidota bacterium]
MKWNEIIIIMIFNVLCLYAVDEPEYMNIYLNSGSTVPVKISDLIRMEIIKGESSSMMIVYNQDSALGYYPTSTLDSINYSFDSVPKINIYPVGIKFSFSLNNLDTIKLILMEDFKEIKIGNQIWMTKNLDVTTYRNGDIIPEVKEANIWDTLTTGAWSYLDNKPEYGKLYGKLYNWYAVSDPRGLAPEGWRVPTMAEADTLRSFLGRENGYNAGIVMKEAGHANWVYYDSTVFSTNESGFTALPGGMRLPAGSFFDWSYCGWWTSTLGGDEDHVYGFGLGYNYNTVQSSAAWNRNTGFSIRCIKE